MLQRITFIRAEKEKKDLRAFSESMDKTARSLQNRKLLGSFLGGIILGTLLLNLFYGNAGVENGLYSEYFVYKFQNTMIKTKDLFYFSFCNHAKEILFLVLLSLTSFGIVTSELYLAYKGIGCAVLVSAYVLQYGIGGVLLYLLSVFPQVLPYTFFVILLAEFGKELYRGGIRPLKLLQCLFVLIILGLVTTCFETFFNLACMRQILG